MLSPTILENARQLRNVWTPDLVSGFLTALLQFAYLLQLFHAMGLPPKKSVAITVLCCLIRLYAVPSILHLTCWDA